MFLSVPLFLLAILSLSAQSNPTLFRQPTISQNSIAFSYAGDLWTVGRSGGDAARLTTGIGIESEPHFSPDGNWIAFTGQYDGNTDVFVIPRNGGIPKRLTFHPSADRVSGWTRDGKKVLFASSRVSSSNFSKLFTVNMEGGGLPNEIPLPMAQRGDISPDGSKIAYEPLSQWQPDWKYYKGGQTQPIWIANLSDSSIEKLPRNNSNDKHPMWIGDKIYFLSDRENGVVTLFEFDTRSKAVEKVVNNSGLEIKNASANGDTIVYEQFGTIYILKAGTKTPQKVNIRAVGDFPGVRKRFENVGNSIQSSTISPKGVRAVFEARGEIFSAPADKGNARNLTNTVGVMERDPAWSPDGKHIAYFSDESGEYMLHLRDQTGMGEVKKIRLGDKPGFFFSPTWSPDSEKIAYHDQQSNLWYLDVSSGKSVKVDTNPIGIRNNILVPSWSPDSKWIAYSKQLENRLRAVFLYSVDSKIANQITDGLADTHYVVFDRSGKYLYLTASTDVGPTISFADLSGIAHQVTHSVYMVVLRNDIPSPLSPESDEEKVKPEATPKPSPAKSEPDEKSSAEETEEKEQTEKPKAPQSKKPKSVRIDLENIDQRIISVSQVPTRNFNGLYAGAPGTLYLTEVPTAPQAPGQFGLTLHKFDLKKRKLDTPKRGISGFTVSADGSQMMYSQRRAWFINSTVRPTPPGKGRVKTNEMQARVDPRAEWKQMFNEVWRGERDFFYDPGTHGLDIEKAKALYAPYLRAISHREDLNYLFREMLNQISIGHMYISGGDIERPQFVGGGLLGADYKIQNGRYQFERIYSREKWTPRLRAPLTEPGVNVKEGEYLISVNGREITSKDNLFQFFENTANKQIVIKVSKNADGKNSRQVTVVPVSSERGLRNLAWVESNRRKVDSLSSGKLAYIYIPNTSGAGYTSFNRYFFSQTNKQGAVVDERFNGGGSLADYVADLVTRQQYARIAFRDGIDWNVPAGAIYGPKAMLINENAGSGGDAMPWFFRKAEAGPLIGKRTWGGLVAAFGIPRLMDGGSVRAPNGAVYGLDGEWEVENVGVAPDIEVEYDPAEWRKGRDPQLETAVKYLLGEIKKNPQKKYKRPPYPDYHKGRKLGKNK